MVLGKMERRRVMKNKLKAMLVAVCVLFPFSARADLDLLSHAQDILSSAEEKVNLLTKQYTGLQFNNITAVTDRGYLRSLRQQARDQLKTHALDAIRSTSLNHFTMAGLKDNFISGPFANSALLRNINKKYIRRTDVRNDYMVTVEHNRRQNRLMVENASTALAKAIVLRGKIMDELKEVEEEEKKLATTLKGEGGEGPQTPVINDAYKKVAIRANGRWANILMREAEFSELNANGRLVAARMVSENDEQADVTEGNDAQEYAQGTTPKNNINLGQAWDLAVNGKGVFETFGSGNIAGGLSGLGSMAGTSGGIFSSTGSTLGQVATGLGGAANVAGAISSGNYVGAVANAFDGTGSVVGNSTGGAIGSIGDVVRTGANVSDAVSSGNGDIWNTMGNATNALSNVANTGANVSGSVTRAEEDAAARRAQNQQQNQSAGSSGAQE